MGDVILWDGVELAKRKGVAERKWKQDEEKQLAGPLREAVSCKERRCNRRSGERDGLRPGSPRADQESGNV